MGHNSMSSVKIHCLPWNSKYHYHVQNSSYHISVKHILILTSDIRPGLPTVQLFPSDFPTKIVYATLHIAESNKYPANNHKQMTHETQRVTFLR